MNINNQIPGTSTYKCDSCCNKIPTGTEKPRWTNVSTHVYKRLFCRSCEIWSGHELSKPYNFDPEQITESPEFKRWKGSTLPFGDVEEAEKNRKNLERVRGGLPTID